MSPALLYCKTQLSSLSLSTEKRHSTDGQAALDTGSQHTNIEHEGSVQAPDEVPLPPTQRDVLELFIPLRLVQPQPLEEVQEQLLLLKRSGPVLHPRVVLGLVF